MCRNHVVSAHVISFPDMSAPQTLGISTRVMVSAYLNCTQTHHVPARVELGPERLDGAVLEGGCRVQRRPHSAIAPLEVKWTAFVGVCKIPFANVP